MNPISFPYNVAYRGRLQQPFAAFVSLTDLKDFMAYLLEQNDSVMTFVILDREGKEVVL
jgi:hypothetical protein